LTSSTDTPTVDERLASAANTSNLRVEAWRPGAGDVLIAAGLAKKTVDYVIGRQLIALHSEWDRAERPRVPSAKDIERMAAKLPQKVEVETDGPNGKTLKSVPRLVAARTEAMKWFDLERMRLLGRLKTLPAAQAGLAEWASRAGIKDAEAKVRAVLLWWLDHHCPRCNGTKYEVVAGTNRQSNRTCKSAPVGCGGTGERPLPHGKDGRLIEAHMIKCIHDARQKIRAYVSSVHVA